MSKPIVFPIRLPQSLYRKMKRVARLERRTVTDWMRLILRDAVQARASANCSSTAERR